MTTVRAIGKLLVVLAAVTSAGCGAVVARAKVVTAESAVVTAQRAGAEKTAPYEYTSAILYLEKAREEENAARFGPAIEFGGLAAKHAEQARLKAVNAEPQPDSE
jgi:hypothetical protein